VLKNGATRLAVATLEEGAELREAKINAPILVLGVSTQDDLEALICYNLIAGIGELEVAKRLSEIAKKYKKSAKIHINIDTGMARLGVRAQEALKVIREIKKLPFEQYRQVIDGLKKEGIHVPLRHVADSATLLDLPSLHLDMVRPGIAIYGAYPSNSVKNRVGLQPVSSFKTKIISLRNLPPGAKVSYGGTYVTTKLTRVATLPVGYADGYSRVMSNQGQVLIRGRRAPIIGRVCMDHCMVDVTHLPEVEVGDEVILWGKQGKEYISLEEIARKMGTIVYEVVPLVDRRRIPRIFLQEKKVVKVQR